MSVSIRPRFLEHLNIGRDRRLGQRQEAADVVDVERPLDVQELQDADPHRGREPLEDLDIVLGVHGQEIAIALERQVHFRRRPASRRLYRSS